MQNTLDERPIEFVEETAFGIWFLSTETWYRHVLSRALNDLQRMLEPEQIYADILDVGCGRGKSLRLLDERFRPQHIIALEPDTHMLREAEVLGAQCNSHVTLLRTSATDTQLPDDAFDMVFCHQTFHHIADQESAMREFYRVLKPGGVLLFAESTKRYIESWIIRLLFRHPMEAQKTAGEYIALIRDTGFNLHHYQYSCHAHHCTMNPEDYAPHLLISYCTQATDSASTNTINRIEFPGGEEDQCA